MIHDDHVAHPTKDTLRDRKRHAIARRNPPKPSCFWIWPWGHMWVPIEYPVLRCEVCGREKHDSGMDGMPG